MPEQEFSDLPQDAVVEFSDLPAGATLEKPASSKRGIGESITDFARELWAQVNPVEGVKGLAHLTAHPIESFKADATARQQVWEKAKQDFESGDAVSGLARTLYAFVPVLGPQLARSGEQLASGEYAKGAGSLAGLGLNLAAPKAVHLPGAAAAGRKLKSAATEMYRSALKPSTALPLERTVAAVETGLEQRIPVSPAGVEKLSSLVDDLNQQVSAEIKRAGPARTISPGRPVANIAEARQRFTQQVNPRADLEAIESAKQEFLDQLRSQPGGAVRNLTAEEAQAMKTGTYQQLKSKSYGELKSATVEAQKALARGLKEELNRAFPELKYLNAEESKLLNLEPILTKAVQRISNRQLIGIGTPITGGAVGIVTGSKGASAVAGIVKAVVDNPNVKSRLAIVLDRAGRRTGRGVKLPLGNVRVQGYLNALGQAVEDASDVPPDDQSTP